MSQPQLSDAEVVELGEAIYERNIRAEVETAHRGRFVAIDVANGQYVLGDRMLSALQQAHRDAPNKRFYVKRVGYDSAVRIGGGFRGIRR